MDWRDSKPKLVDQIWLMYENQIRTDLAISVSNGQNNQTFQCHKTIILRLSSAFETMIFNLQDGECLNVSDCEPNHFSKIVKFDYTEKMNLESATEALGIYNLSKQYQIKQVEKLCTTYLSSKVTCDSVWIVLDSFGSMSILKKRNATKTVEKFIEQNTEACLASEYFLQCSQSDLEFLLSKPRLNVDSELQIILAVTRWCQRQLPDSALDPEKAKNLLGLSLLRQIRFLSLSPSEFWNHVTNSGLLSKVDCEAVMATLSDPDQKKRSKLPDYICGSTKPRKKKQEGTGPLEAQVDEKPPSAKGQDLKEISGKSAKKQIEFPTKEFVEDSRCSAKGNAGRPAEVLFHRGPDMKFKPTNSSKKTVDGLNTLVAEAKLSMSSSNTCKGIKISFQSKDKMENDFTVDLQLAFSEFSTGPKIRRSQIPKIKFKKGCRDKVLEADLKYPMRFEERKVYSLVVQLTGTNEAISERDLGIVRMHAKYIWNNQFVFKNLNNLK